ncbi:MAG: hypothetical protein ACRCY8_04415 [Dermatophilaceae bacterium]
MTTSWGRARASAVAAVLTSLAALTGLAGCSAGDAARDDDGRGGAPVVLEQVRLPAGVAPVAVTAAGDRVLVGGRAPDGSSVRPRLYLGADAARLAEVPVAPVSPTAFEAKWFQLDLTAQGQVTALAGAPAGAHSNTRWSTWSGTADGVRELTQPFQTFGGWGAGALNGYVRTSGGEAIVGSWQGSTGADIAVWRLAGERWTRTPTAAGSALASTAQLLAAARRAAPRGDGAIASGSVTELRPGSVTLRPAVWVADSLDGSWRRVDLPSSATLAEAHAAGCSPDRCTVVGQADGRLVAWVVAADGRVTPVEGLPSVGVGDKVQLLAPMLADDGTHRFVVADGAAGQVVEVAADGAVAWRPYSAPGVPVAAATTSAGVVWVVHEAADGSTSLHTMRPL